MNFDSIFFYLIGAFGLIGGVLGKDWSLWISFTPWYKPSKEAKRFGDIFFGLFCLAIGYALSKRTV